MTTTQMVFFAGKTNETTVTKKTSVAEDWVRAIRSRYKGEHIVVGLDCEWKPPTYMNHKTATLPLCINDKCLKLQQFYIDYIPQSLKDFLNDPTFTFVGVEVEDDVAKLRNEYGLNCSSTADLLELAKIHMLCRWPDPLRKPGLKVLAKEVTGLTMIKPLHVTKSNWENREFTNEQIEYGSIDACASYRFGRKLVKGI